jgi:hypothetical protein
MRIACIFSVSALLCLGFSASPSLAQDTSGEQDIFDLILEVKRGRNILSPAVIGLEKNGKHYIPLQEIARLVKFNIKTNLNAGTATGFYINENNSYALDVSNQNYTLKGDTFDFDDDEAFIFSQELDIGDIYITPNLINKIWPLEINFNPLEQVVNIQTKRKLPYEQSSDRVLLRNKLLNRATAQQPNVDYPRIVNKYKFFSPPALDLTATTSTGGLIDGIDQNLNITGRHDLLKAQANYNFSFSKQPNNEVEFDNSRFLLERKSYDAGELPLGLQLLQAGDVRPRVSRLIDGSLSGRGFLFSTQPNKQNADFDQIIVEGFIEPGWEVELYRNNELVAFQTVDASGEYRFEDIELNYNNTIVKTVFYGPEGQIREEEKSYNISTALLQPGKTVFEGSALDLNRDLIKNSSHSSNAPQGLAQRYQISQGINRALSVFSSFTQTPTREDTKEYATIGANISAFGLSNFIEVYKDFSGGEAVDIRNSTRFAGINLNMRNAFYNNFESDEAGFGNSARKMRTEFSASRPIKFFSNNLGLRFNLDHETFEDVDDKTEIDFSQSFARKNFRITHGNTTNLIDKNHRVTDGRINTTYRINPQWQVRSQLNYDIFPEWDTRNIIGELRYRDGNKFTAALNTNRSLQDQSTRIGGQVAYDFDKFRTALDVDWDRDSGWRGFLRTSTSLAPYDESGDYIYSSRNLSQRTAFNGRVFLDKNDDGFFNEGDQPIEDAIINIGRRGTDLSDASGVARYTGPAQDQYENISLDQDSLENPFLVSQNTGYNAVLRPGTATNMTFPVSETGLIEGTIFTENGPLAGVKIQLLNASGDVIDITTTAFDGYYTFEYLGIGDYIVRVDPVHDKIKVADNKIILTAEDLFHYDANFDIQSTEIVMNPIMAPTTSTEKDNLDTVTQPLNQIVQEIITSDEKCLEALNVNDAQSIKDNCHAYLTARNNQTSNFIRVEDVRVGRHTEFTRIVLDLSEPLHFQVLESVNGQEVSVLLPYTDWSAKKNWKNKKPKILDSYRVEPVAAGGSRLILKPKDQIYVLQSERLSPDKKYGNRIFIDLSNEE